MDPRAHWTEHRGDRRLGRHLSPRGNIDPIDEMGVVALEHDIGFHVDGCLGAFILAWGERAGVDVPPFDFGVPGVTSLSADTHKYGYALPRAPRCSCTPVGNFGRSSTSPPAAGPAGSISHRGWPGAALVA